MTRLPTPQDARQIMAAGTGSPAHQKARDTLFKAIEWAFNGLAEPLKQQVTTAYTNKSGGQFRWLLDKAYRGFTTPERVETAVECLQLAEPKLTFSMDRYQPITDDQAAVFGEVLGRFRTYLDEINAGTHDDTLDRVFLNPSADDHDQDQTRAEVKRTFQLAYAVVSGWYTSTADRAAKIRIDTTLDIQKVGGLSSPRGLELPAKFFDRNGPMSADKKLSTLVHESTHAIQDRHHATDDKGGYIGSGAFAAAPLAVRQKNASHYQYVFEQLLGLPDPQPTGVGADPNVTAAKSIVQMAWIYAISAHSQMMEFATTPRHHTNARWVKRMELYGQLFGLRAGQAVVRTGALFWKSKSLDVTVSDTSGMENRVSRLGLYLGAVEEAAEALPVGQRTRDRILLKLVEMGGAIRSSSTPAKTVAMLKVAAMNCHQAKGQYSTAKRSKALKKFLGHQYDDFLQLD